MGLIATKGFCIGSFTKIIRNLSQLRRRLRLIRTGSHHFIGSDFQTSQHFDLSSRTEVESTPELPHCGHASSCSMILHHIAQCATGIIVKSVTPF
jgi:hypothetical protein